MNQVTKSRTNNQREKILQSLRDAGVYGITNEQLSKIALRFNARIQELYVKGYGINVTVSDNGVSTYVLVSEPIIPQSKPQDALNVLMQEIEDMGGVIKSDQLADILQRMNFTVRRKVGTFNKKVI